MLVFTKFYKFVFMMYRFMGTCIQKCVIARLEHTFNKLLPWIHLDNSINFSLHIFIVLLEESELTQYLLLINTNMFYPI